MSDEAKFEPLPDSITVKFDQPIKLADGERSEMKFRKPKGRDMVAIGAYASPGEFLIKLSAQLGDVGYDELLELDLKDLNKIVDEVQVFL